MTEPTTPSKRKRRQVMTQAGRQLLQKERGRMAKEQALLGEALAEEARRTAAMGERIAQINKPEDAAISRGIVRRVAGVLASEGVNPIIECVNRPQMNAWTDFTKIHVGYKKFDDIRLTAATIRGLMYHEGGHIRWTTPWLDLLSAHRDVYLNQLLAQGLEGPFPPEFTREELSQLQRAWNCLEDQRMETAVVSDSPRKAAYFTPTVMEHNAATPAMAAANYPLLIWRRYLPKHLRRSARAAFIDAHAHSPLDIEAVTRQIEACVTRYVRATDYETMFQCVVEMWKLLLCIRPLQADMSDAGHGYQGRKPREPGDEQELTIPIDPTMLEEDEDTFPSGEGADFPFPVPSPSNEPGDEPGEGEGEGGDTFGSLLDDQPLDGTPTPNESGDADEADEPGGNSAGEKSDTPTTHGPGEDELTQDDIDEIIAEAEEDRLEDPALEGDVEAYHDALDSQVSDLPAYIGGLSTDADAIAISEALADEIELAFRAATMDRAPAWIEQQKRGIININRYITRQPGDVEFFRNWIDSDQPGYNIAVSVLLDYSGSMVDHTTELAQVGYACKQACSKLDIPCTVTLWDDRATTLYDATEVAEGLPIIATASTTNPDMALADLPNQRFGKEHHIVLIMTDGDWDSEWEGGYGKRARKVTRTLAHYATEGQYIIGFGYNGDRPKYADKLAKSLYAKGCPEAYGITDLMDIPRRLEDTLIALA